MEDQLLNYYERELTFIRKMGAEFAKTYPKIAGRLLLEPDKCDDPHTERLIEAFAFLAGRIHKKIDDNLFTNPLYNEANYIYDKIKERGLKLGDITDIELLGQIEANAKKGAYIQRYKGLGEMNPEQLWETTMSPENRRLLLVKIEDFDTASETFTLFMGDEVEPRRAYIEKHAKDVIHLDI